MGDEDERACSDSMRTGKQGKEGSFSKWAHLIESGQKNFW